MRKIKEVLRLWLVLSLRYREIARTVGAARSTVTEYISKAESLGLTWEQVEDLSETDLELKLFPPMERIQVHAPKPMPDWQEVDQELRSNKSVTLILLWQEYREQHPEGYSYSQYHFHFSRWKKKQGLVMRQQHRAGEKLFVDYCDGPNIISSSGEPVKTQIFVAVWGASNYGFAQASLSQELPNWINSHVRAFEYFGCVPYILVPDNLKSGVSRACRYEPDLNPTYQDLAMHYGAAVVPARPYKARDKAKVERGVQLVQRWILARLRKRTFYSLAELNTAIAELLVSLNTRVMKRIGKTRKERFEALDRAAALPLAATAYQYATWAKSTLGLDYHVFADKHYYSVPCHLVGEEIHIRVSTNTVEAFYKGSRVASHVRSAEIGGTTTDPAHMPRSHREHAGMNLEVARTWAEATGPATAKLFEKIWQKHNQAPSALGAFRGIYRLGLAYERDRIERAAARAVAFGSCTYTSMKRILSSGLDQQQLNNEKGSTQTLPNHENIRGSQFYSEENSIC